MSVLGPAIEAAKDAVLKAEKFLAQNASKLPGATVDGIKDVIAALKDLIQRANDAGIFDDIKYAGELAYQTAKLLGLVAEAATEIIGEG